MGKLISTNIYTANINDDVINCDCKSGALSLTLYKAAENAGKEVFIQKTDTTGNAITVYPVGNEKIDGANTATISTNGQFLRLLASVDGWYVVDSNTNELANYYTKTQTYTKTELNSTTDNSSGGDKIGMTAISGISGTTAQSQMESMKALVDTIGSGGSIDLSNATYSTEATVTQEITSLPSTAIKGTLKATLAGNTEINFVKNGNFANGDNWAPVAGTESVASNVYSLTGDGSAANVLAVQDTPLSVVTDKKVYVRCYARVTNANATSIALKADGSTAGTETSIASQATPTSNTWYKLEGILTTPNDFTGVYRINIYQSYADAATANTKVMQIKEVMAIDLTSRYGAGNEPDAGTCALRYANWFDGVKSTDRVRVVGVGKNLFDGSFESGTITNSGANSADSTRIRTTNHIKILPSTSYVIDNVDSLVSVRACAYDKDKNFISTVTLGAFTSPSNAFYVRWSYTSTNINSRDQLRVSAASTTYEAYTETTAIVPVELKKISNTVKDTFDANTGKHTKNISDWVTLSGSVASSGAVTDYTAYKRVMFQYDAIKTLAVNFKALFIKYNFKKLTTLESSSVNIDEAYHAVGSTLNIGIGVADTDSGWADVWDGTTTFTGMTWENLIKGYMNGWKLTTADTNVANCVWTGIASGTTKSGSSGYADVTTTIDTGFTPYRMIYQLATPITTNYMPHVLTAEPNGTIYTEPFINDVGLYGSNIAIENTSYPISSLAYVNRIDVATGALTPIALSSCTVASGGLTFTISGATAGQYYDYGYTYKDLSTVADLTYSFATNLKAQVNSNTTEIANLDKQIETLYAIEKARVNIAPVTIGAVSATTTMISFIAPYACVLNKFKLATKDDITASDTDYWTITLTDKGATGTDSNTIATKTTKTTGGQAFAAYDMWDIGTLDATHRVLAEGDVVTLTLTKTGSATAFAEARGSVEFMAI